ncbi:dienelactone hydrolase family protein [Actinoplanes derwentensis]|uniref:Dienelactone hydrolase n=1 Tax=Actinoplanes derwentensis TaxID=113562 RepID=A0A1H1QXL6_9ACTN|nr:alpha/beta fold hydrolase [Actinoplanes derwentensis]GID87092.1 hydrolase [Actinoplanes derwentensis]SDS28106.1 Dienelactone hydrolase [Actinoplanes derwentensis]
MKRRSVISLPAVALAAPHLADARAAAGFEGPSVIDGNLPVFYERLRDELTFPLGWSRTVGKDAAGNQAAGSRAGGSQAAGRDWKRRARATVEEHLQQGPERAAFAPEVIDEQAAAGYRRRQIVFNVTRHSRVRATMLIPDGAGPFPAALLLHDHGARFDIGKEKLIEPWYDETRRASASAWATKYFSGRFVGDQLAARGYVVLAVDALGWGDRGGLTYEGQQALASNLFNLGSSPAGLMAREDARAAALLATLPEVDPRRIAAVGFSMGGYRAWQVAALSDHIAATVSVCWMTGLKEMMVPGNNTLRGQSAFYMLHPGLYRHLDIPDVAGIAAPRPMFVMGGELDPLFTAEGIAVAYRKLALIWSAQRASRNLRTKTWPGLGHIFTAEMQDEAFSWLDANL